MTRTRKLIVAAGIAAVVSGGGVAIAAAAVHQDPDPPELDRAAEVARAAAGDGDVTAVEQDDGGYDVEIRRADGTETEFHLDRSLQVTRTEDEGADADDGTDDDAPLDEAARAKAAEAALASVGSGTVTEVESEDGGYDVEVRQADGSEMDVQLDRSFAVVSTQTDTED